MYVDVPAWLSLTLYTYHHHQYTISKIRPISFNWVLFITTFRSHHFFVCLLFRLYDKKTHRLLMYQTSRKSIPTEAGTCTTMSIWDPCRYCTWYRITSVTTRYSNFCNVICYYFLLPTYTLHDVDVLLRGRISNISYWLMIWSDRYFDLLVLSDKTLM